MLKVATMALVAVGLAGTASAVGWRSLRIDASTEAAFEQSLAKFDDKLSPGRRYVFGESLEDIWAAGTQAAQAEQRGYTEADYLRQLDGLSYEEIVRFLDPTGQTARRYRAAYNPYAAGDRTRYGARVYSTGPNPWIQPAPMRESGPNWRGGTPLHGPTFPQN